MHDYPPLVSGALHLLFRHFNQRQEVLQAFRQVQLLVSDSDIESYKQIKTDLDILRQCVEKSELWVYKSKNQNDDDQVTTPRIEDTPNIEGLNQTEQVSEYQKIQDILIRMNKLCIQNGPNGVVKPKKHEQRLLRNVGVHTIVLDLLQVPYDEKNDAEMNKLMNLAHQFLQNFCLGNQNNQVLLHKQLDLFLNPGSLYAETVCAIFKDNLVLCNEVNEKVIQHFVHCIEIHGRHVEYLKFLQTIVRAENQFIRKCQDMVMQELVNAGEDVLIFYNDKASFNNFTEMMRKYKKGNLEDSNALNYHVELVRLLACCTMGECVTFNSGGKNFNLENFQSIFFFEKISISIFFGVRKNFIQFFIYFYFEIFSWENLFIFLFFFGAGKISISIEVFKLFFNFNFFSFEFG